MTPTELIGSIEERINKKRSFLIYKRPFQDSCEIMFPEPEGIVPHSHLEEIELQEGFVLSPFLIDHDRPLYSIRAIKHIIPLNELLTYRGPLEKAFEGPMQGPECSTSRSQHCKRVELAIQKIKSGVMDKVVLAKKKCLTGKVDAFVLFLKAIEKYPSAFVYLIQLPDRGVWIGASPERMLQIKDGRAKIDSLAATQKGNKGERTKDWSEKEYDEQRIVTKYIDGLLDEQGVVERSWTQPKDHVAGALIHLKSTVEFALNWGKGRAMQLLKALHPTPAVCGSPKTKALLLIEELEDFDREFYAGFLGPVDMNGSTELYVNLRCLHIQDDRIEIFAGGGITRSSDPEAEWLETEHKCGTMLDLLD